VKGGGVREGKANVLAVSDNSMVVKAADGVENGADDSDGIVLGRLAFCEDTVKGSLLVVSSKEYFVLDLKP